MAGLRGRCVISAGLLADRSLLGAYRAHTESIVLHDVFRVYLRHEIDIRV